MERESRDRRAVSEPQPAATMAVAIVVAVLLATGVVSAQMPPAAGPVVGYQGWP